MEEALEIEKNGMLLAQARVLHFTSAYVDSMALRCAVELRIADIINAHGVPISLAKIAADIGSSSSSPDISGLARLMRFLVHKKLFDELPPPDSEKGETYYYGLNHASKLLLHDSKFTLAPYVSFSTDPCTIFPWYHLCRSIKEGGTAYKRANGQEVWEFASHNLDFNRVLNQGMASAAKITTNAILSDYEGGFDGIGTLVDVGGGVGTAIGEIVKAYPHIKGINFDLAHVIATAPACVGVTHVGGDMFEAIPHADCVFMKWIMHDWNDDDCVKILKNCRKAIPEKTGKLIIVDMVFEAGGDGLFADIGHASDMVMFAHFSTAKERTEIEWKKILKEGGFLRYKIVKIPAVQSIIEAYLE